ncbi:MAG: single-stranded DNA-binding protein [Elusimicrobia bacterium CG03_land_8_20_14_0_80_50_18]|nr:MAG: single-stranded DNA-binding protein [Elusimicrobia bacterium CG03_land_8_20_14_0_80_50_18]
MANFNKVMIMGNLTKDPEKRYTKTDQAVTHFTVASNSVYRDKSGERKEQVSFVPVSVWGKQAENCDQYLQKGSPVFVEGRLVSSSWESPQGERKFKLEVTAQSVQFLSGGPKRAGGESSADADSVNIQDEPPGGPSEDEVPF